MVQPINQETLRQIATPSVSPMDYVNSRLKGEQVQQERQAQQQQMQLRDIQMQRGQQQIQQQKYDYEAIVGQATLNKKALAMAPPEEGADAKAWQKYGRAQEAGGYNNAAKSAYDIAEALMSSGGMALPDGFKNYPELAKLQHLRRVALSQQNLTEAKELNDRIAKLKDNIEKRPPAPKLESSQTTAGNIAARAGLGGATMEGKLALALGDLSRSLTQEFAEKYDISQSQVNDMLAGAFLALDAKESIWVNDPEITSAMVEQQLRESLLKAQATESAEDAGRGVDTITPTKEDVRNELLNRYTPK